MIVGPIKLPPPPEEPPEFERHKDGKVVVKWYYNHFCGCYMTAPVVKQNKEDK